MFHVTFDRPRLGFVCNHDAIFGIKIKEGYYNADYSKASTYTPADRYEL